MRLRAAVAIIVGVVLLAVCVQERDVAESPHQSYPRHG
jgi:hypothetical protein